MAALEAGNPRAPEALSLEISGSHDELGVNYSQRAQWLRAAVLGANDGLISVSSLMLGVGAVKQDVKSMILTGFAGMVAGACSMAIEFVSVYSQKDIEVSQMKRQNEEENGKQSEDEGENEDLPNPFKAAAASALAFVVGAMLPLISASFIQSYKARLGVVIAVASLALVMFGGLAAFLGKAPVKRSCLRILTGGLLAMAITYGLTKLIGLAGVQGLMDISNKSGVSRGVVFD
ncbi:vacuolar iron transporter homolog 3-like [Macadamia integrifolia]|uniref:vacuolar iron transporter homolog 3-like n=1 Tax=Macadamia integrifolia TaxID=60698 RepID=UPI001C52D3AF|nr:vacuolar iron transporter homolog 3-like [Macadamia integrifolia]